MKILFAFAFSLILSTVSLIGQSDKVVVQTDDSGSTLLVNGKPFMINGMNWDYVPIGTNFSYNFWNNSDSFIKAALDSEMSLLKNMGVNTIRVYTGIQPKWVQYIYENYGIYTMLNHSFGRYGLTINGTWMANTEYSDPDVKKFLMSEAKSIVRDFKETPGLLLFMLGNENNYGLSWGGAETEDIPIETEGTVITRARAMYKVMNEAVLMMKKMDGDHPIAICNGDLLYLDLVAEHCTDIDIYATNMYRGVSFSDAFERVKNELNKPIMFAEFGSDAFNALNNSEDQKMQAYYMVNNWKEIYGNAAGLGGVGNSIGGFTFQFSDGWWKKGQTKDLDYHNTEASWLSKGYSLDTENGSNNMNEEWFGICAKGKNNERGLYELYPRAAYYALKEAHELNVYSEGLSKSGVNAYFDNIGLMDAVIKARGDKAALMGKAQSKLSVSRLTANFTTYNTGGSLITTPDEVDPNNVTFPNRLGFDHMQSFFVGIEANPAPGMRANVEFNITGNVAQNPINEIFYENRARPLEVNTTNNGPTVLNDNNRLAVYRADFTWNHKDFDLTGFYRTGHYHWGYEGDFFGLYPEANYGPNIDIYNGAAPVGVEIKGKRSLKGFTLAMGPELWWGANPAVLVKYDRKLAGFDVTGIFHEDIDQRGESESSFAIPQPKTRRATLYLKREFGKLGFEIGGIWGGQPLQGREFQIVDGEPGNYTTYKDEINSDDTWGGKVKLTYAQGKVNWYASAAAQGLVANGGADLTKTYTGWRLKDSGSGNQYNVLSGFTYSMGKLQIAPNFMWQRPVEGPIPGEVSAPGRPRNILTDPFSVRANRETVAGEILFTFDPTPGTWMYEWDNDRAEDAKFAMSAGFVFRHLPTTQDAAIGIFPDGRTFFAFPGAAPATDLWEAHARIVSKLNPDLGIVANIYGGTAQANGSDQREIERLGVDVRAIHKSMKYMVGFKVNDWGPYDYHRDFNLTYPQQLMADVSVHLGSPSWLNLPSTNIGIQGLYRTLDQYSPRYNPTQVISPAGELVPDPTAPGYDNGNEWEIRTYVRLNIFK